jgi:methionyl-tRNA formyltransferase
MALRVLFMGSPAFAVPSLTALHQAGHHVCAAVCQPDAPRGRGHRLQPPEVKVEAERLGIPVLQPARVRGEQGRPFLDGVKAMALDVGVVAAYGKILPQELLDAPRAGFVNLHASLLPRHRGASPIHHAILEGDPETGVCLMRMVLALDAGGVFSLVRTPLSAEDTAESVTARLAAMAADLCVRDLPAVVDGTLQPEPQDASRVTYAPLLHKELGRLDWTGEADREARRVRALTPWPGTHTTWKGQPLKVHRASAVAGEPAAAAAGTVVLVAHGHLDVACGTGTLRLWEVQPADKKRMDAGAYARGARLVPGDVLGT